ncbi:MAG: hypothetical protein GQ569_01665 [Methylococcaceae bacterium]|nr:hypothetical protein [Methylococcaceae bacterium]
MSFLIMNALHSMDNHILPECYLDTNLMESLLPTKKGYNHQKGCNEVIRVMQHKFKGRFAVGILDRDKDSPDKLKTKNFNFIDEKHNLRLYRHQSEHHYLILHPPIEKWLIAESKQVNLSLEFYNLSSNLDELKKLSKPKTSKDNPRFKTVFEKLKEHNANGITQLLNWTDYLIKNPDNADETYLKNIGNAS